MLGPPPLLLRETEAKKPKIIYFKIYIKIGTYLIISSRGTSISADLIIF